jgi:predicted transcriptional regulator
VDRQIPLPASRSSEGKTLEREEKEKGALRDARQRLKVYRAIDDDCRLSILVTLSRNPDLAFNEVARSLGIDTGLLAYHLGVLKHVGLVDGSFVRRGKNTTRYCLTEEGIQVLKEFKLA